MEKNITPKTNNIMDYNNCIWLNHYDRHGELTTSTPYPTFADAIAMAEEIERVVNPRFREELRYQRVSAFTWKAPVGKEMRIETKGDLFMHIADTWVGISANYDCDMELVNNMTHDKAFLLRLFGLTQLDNDRLFAFADEFWGKNVAN